MEKTRTPFETAEAKGTSVTASVQGKFQEMTALDSSFGTQRTFGNRSLLKYRNVC